MIAHDRKIPAACNAHAHDGRDLRNSHGRHDSVIAKHATEIVGVGENVFLQRQKHTRGVHQVDGRDAVFHRDILRTNDFFRRHGEERAGLHRGIVGDDHDHAGLDAGKARDHAGGGRAAPFVVHAKGGVGAEFKEGVGIDEFLNAFARGQAALAVLAFDRLGATALANLLFLIADG